MNKTPKAQAEGVLFWWLRLGLTSALC